MVLDVFVIKAFCIYVHVVLPENKKIRIENQTETVTNRKVI